MYLLQSTELAVSILVFRIFRFTDANVCSSTSYSLHVRLRSGILIECVRRLWIFFQCLLLWLASNVNRCLNRFNYIELFPNHFYWRSNSTTKNILFVFVLCWSICITQRLHCISISWASVISGIIWLLPPRWVVEHQINVYNFVRHGMSVVLLEVHSRRSFSFIFWIPVRHISRIEWPSNPIRCQITRCQQMPKVQNYAICPFVCVCVSEHSSVC